MPAGFPVEGFRSGREYRAQPGDIVITTYPKCGTTWVQHIVYLILHEGEPLPAGRSMTEEIPHLEEVGREAVERLPAPRCIKTHLPFDMTPSHPDARYVYVARNPFDCAVSFFHHTRGFVRLYDFADGTFDEFFEYFLAGEVDFGDYFDNLVPWFAHRTDDNLLFLTYEQMKAAPAEAVVAIGEFLGPDSSRAVHDQVALERIVRHSSFDSMRKDPERWSSKRPDGMPEFIRKGEVGDWSNVFTRDQARRLADKFARRAEGTDLETLWPDILAAARA
ncbi:MAG: sulfotransferase domain-containing protein [Vicinamibacterales bacterium]|jgi:hypothetical protein|nr:sulfotransferase [Acidobacteriota bacterium]MDP6608215.1 sulfotransferase domain-containing protein [Vicinamibacterales bacterium]HAK55176.1 sulfotransferase [Acidobacteriota bacterium]|tara:strand:- start:8843 stop:9673 length:831 start_codon:yes stop_codon:yes gene_type:complete